MSNLVKNFGSYSEYYNLLYEDKDYKSETDFIDSIITRYCYGASTILDLGCGTGKHDIILATKGYDVSGFDISKSMLATAREQRSKLTDSKLRKRLSFNHGDVRKIRTENTYDVVISLFHVVSYQKSNIDLREMFATAYSNLKTGGLFVFDYWYGPAVLSDPPKIRLKEVENAEYCVSRNTSPILFYNSNTVELNFELKVNNKLKASKMEFSEKHTMRYLFQPELSHFLDEAGFHSINTSKWMTDEDPDQSSWNVHTICLKR